MRLKDKILQDIDKLEPDLLPMVHYYIKSLKQTVNKNIDEKKGNTISHKEVQELLSSSKTNWSDELSQEREERT